MDQTSNIVWIDAATRKPTQADADKKGCVIVWHCYNGAMITGWHQFDSNGNGFLTHWAPKPNPPPGFPEWEDEKEKGEES